MLHALVEVAAESELEAYDASKAGDMKPDSVADSGWRSLRVDHDSIASRRPLTVAVHVTIDSK